MSLRTRILLFLFGFALLPLLVAVVINLPLVLDRVELFYRQAFLQNLRADFSDLDTHLASRDEMIRLLAKLPEPGVVLGEEQGGEDSRIDLARLKYTEWINRILSDQLDIVDIVFLDRQGVARFWLSRNPATRLWEPTTVAPRLPAPDSINVVLQATTPAVLLTPVVVNENASDLSRAMTLQLISPLGPAEGKPAYGAVVMTVDIGGLVRRDPDTLWVHDDGRYLTAPGIPARENTAFDEFPGLKEEFAKRKLFMWEGDDGRTVIWVPLLRTENDLPLWVGRQVQNGPLRELRDALILRVLIIIFVLVIAIGFIARFVAARLERYGAELFKGIQRIVGKSEAVQFRWRGSPELRQLGENLSVLSQTHAQNLRELQGHTKALEESNRYKSEFLSNVSHELRTPLNSILLLSKLLVKEEHGLDDEQRRQLRVIHEASVDLRGLIDNILDLSRIEAGRLLPNVEEVDIPLLLQELVDLMYPQFQEKGLRLELDIESRDVKKIQTDPDKLKQILKNFLSNALKFTREGKVVLGMEAAEAPFAIRLWVRDTGIGIAADKQKLIFEAFKQADGSTRRRYGGTGLGLSISRELAIILCGRIEVQSRPGMGAEFSLLLPAECGEQPQPKSILHEEAEQDETDAALREEAVADFSGRKALLVEQDFDVLLKFSKMLESWRIQVFAASDEEEVRETLEEEPDIDIVLAGEDIMDWRLLSELVGGSIAKSVLVVGLSDNPQADGAELVLSPDINAQTLKAILQQQFPS
ncbi:sensor histidine kinase [Thiolapillus sp.]